MKLLITVQGVHYEVDVQVMEEDAGSPAVSAPAASTAPAPSGGSAAAAAPAQPPAPASRPAGAPAPSAGGAGEVRSPLAGNVLDVKVKPGDNVQVNDVLIVVEAMKMESNIVAASAGVIDEVLVKNGDSVAAEDLLIKMS